MATSDLPTGYVFTTLLLLLLLDVTQSVAVANSNTAPGRNSARCIALSNGFPYKVSKNSGVCHAKKASMSQPRTCKKQACEWCLQYMPFFMVYPCSNKSLRQVCRNFDFNPKNGNQGTGPASMQSPKPSPMISRKPRPSPSNKPSRMFTPLPTVSSNKNNNIKNNNVNNHNTPPSRFPNVCTWTGTGNNTVIDLGRLQLPKYWYPLHREGNYGMILLE